MTSRLFVANIPYAATEEDLRQAFEDRNFRPSEVRLIVDRETNRSKGYGFVELPSPADAKHAIEQMDGQAELFGRFLAVKPAEQRTDRGPRPRSDRNHDW